MNLNHLEKALADVKVRGKKDKLWNENELPNLQDVKSEGMKFIMQYYDTLTKNRAEIQEFYSEQSKLTYEGEQFMGRGDILGKLNSLPEMTFDVENIDDADF